MNIVRTYALDKEKEKQVLLLPKNSRILSVCVIHEQIKVFVEEDANAITYSHILERFHEVEFAIFYEKRYFYVDDYNYLGTLLLNYGNNIYHVFYRNV